MYNPNEPFQRIGLPLPKNNSIMAAVEPVRIVLRRFHRGLPDVIVRQGASFLTHSYSVELIFSGDGMFREDVMTRTPYPTLGGSRHQPPPAFLGGLRTPDPPDPAPLTPMGAERQGGVRQSCKIT